MNFDLSAASEKKVVENKKYQQVGIYDNVVISSFELKQSSTGKDFLSFNTLGANGEIGKSSSLWLTEAAWPVTARTLVDLLVATNGVTDDEAKVMIAVATPQELLAKVTALLVGKKLRAVFHGEESSKGNVIAVYKGCESMKVPSAETKLYFNASKHIKPYQGTIQKTAEITAKSDETSDLPF